MTRKKNCMMCIHTSVARCLDELCGGGNTHTTTVTGTFSSISESGMDNCSQYEGIHFVAKKKIDTVLLFSRLLISRFCLLGFGAPPPPLESTGKHLQ